MVLEVFGGADYSSSGEGLKEVSSVSFVSRVDSAPGAIQFTPDTLIDQKEYAWITVLPDSGTCIF